MAVNWNISKSDLPVDLLARVPKARALKVRARSAPSLETIAQRASHDAASARTSGPTSAASAARSDSSASANAAAAIS